MSRAAVKALNTLQTTAARPFPWRCGACRERAVSPAQVDYTVDAVHDGRKYSLAVPGLDVLKCAKCGELVLDAAANQRITKALRARVGLLGLTEGRESSPAKATLSKGERVNDPQTNSGRTPRANLRGETK